MKVKSAVEGVHDRDVRRPELIINLASELGLMPTSSQVIRITGSKGKGTTTRFCAQLAQALRPSSRIALFVSPEEIEHTDRMRINGVPIDAAVFTRIASELKTHVRKIEQTLEHPHYISPLGYFLLIALKWFKEERVDHYVLECGRGVEFDDVGQISSACSVVTSILLEHPQQLGPTIEDISSNKFAIARNSESVVVSEQAFEFAPAFISRTTIRIVRGIVGPSERLYPAWLDHDLALARVAVGEWLAADREYVESLRIKPESASFQTGVLGGKFFVLEAAINSASIDSAFLASIPSPVTFLVSLPDDKDRSALIALLTRFGAVREIALTGTRGYLHFSAAMKSTSTIEIDADGIDALYEETQKHEGTIYFLGTQSYIRLVKRLIETAN
jgi:hypothetical protein